jgi:hypothetical protein
LDPIIHLNVFRFGHSPLFFAAFFDFPASCYKCKGFFFCWGKMLGILSVKVSAFLLLHLLFFSCAWSFWCVAQLMLGKRFFFILFSFFFFFFFVLSASHVMVWCRWGRMCASHAALGVFSRPDR